MRTSLTLLFCSVCVHMHPPFIQLSICSQTQSSARPPQPPLMGGMMATSSPLFSATSSPGARYSWFRLNTKVPCSCWRDGNCRGPGGRSWVRAGRRRRWPRPPGSPLPSCPQCAASTLQQYCSNLLEQGRHQVRGCAALGELHGALRGACQLPAPGKEQHPQLH